MTRNNKIFRKTKNFWFGTISSRCLSLKVISLESACHRIKLNKIKKNLKDLYFRHSILDLHVIKYQDCTFD